MRLTNGHRIVSILLTLGILAVTVGACGPAQTTSLLSPTTESTLAVPQQASAGPESRVNSSSSTPTATVVSVPTVTLPIIVPDGKPGPLPYPTPAWPSLPVLSAEGTVTPYGTPTPVATRLVGPGQVPRSAPFTSSPLVVDEELDARIKDYLGPESGNYGIVVKRLTDGRGVAINADQEFNAASLFKVLVMYEVYKQRNLGLLSFSESLTVTPPYLDYQLGDQRWPLWGEVPIRDLLEAMITESDNIAAILLQDKTGGWNIIADLNSIGLQHTNLDGQNIPTSAGDMAMWLEMIARGQAVDEKTSQEMLGLLSRQKIDNGLRTLLPQNIVVAHKTGNWSDATHDVGIVYAPSGAYVIAVLSNKSWQPAPIAQIAKLVLDHFEGPAATATPAN